MAGDDELPKLSLEDLGTKVRGERGDQGLRETAISIGISPASLSRVERGHLPDLTTFGLICQWLGISASEILGVEIADGADEHDPEYSWGASVHFRADQNPSEELSTHLAELIRSAQRKIQRQRSFGS